LRKKHNFNLKREVENTKAAELEEVFSRAGRPVAIIKDTDATLNKGIPL